jgi:hypothetical protein
MKEIKLMISISEMTEIIKQMNIHKMNNQYASDDVILPLYYDDIFCFYKVDKTKNKRHIISELYKYRHLANEMSLKEIEELNIDDL